MKENSTDSKTTVEANMMALKEALCVQQLLLQKLYNELDVEREASATAASEALAMILRLQGEKAAVKMEAEHYKRLAEEKMYHAEESMEVFEDLIYQKEIEIASLDHQLRAYRYKLSSLGIEDLGVSEMKVPENMLQQNETLVGETNPENLSRRNSAPPKLLKLAYLKRDRSGSPDSDVVSKRVEESVREDRNLDSEKPTDGSSSVDINSYWDHIRKLDKIVEEIAGEQFVISTARSSSDRDWSLEKPVDDDILSVHDVFEVPETDEIVSGLEKQTKDNGKTAVKIEKKAGKLVRFPEEGMKSLFLKHDDKSGFFPRDGIIVDCHIAVDRPDADSSGGQRSAQITELITEQVTSTGREEELRLLYGIRAKLDSIQSEIRSGNAKTKKSARDYELPMLQLTEAMLHFWI